jgi:hypothetical protein
MQKKRMRGESAKQVAIDVLRSAGEPLHTKEITKRVIDSYSSGPSRWPCGDGAAQAAGPDKRTPSRGVSPDGWARVVAIW